MRVLLCIFVFFWHRNVIFDICICIKNLSWNYGTVLIRRVLDEFPHQRCWTVPSGYPIPDPNPIVFPLPDPYPKCFRNFRVFRVSGIWEINAFSLIPPWSHFWWLEHRPVSFLYHKFFHLKCQSNKASWIWAPHWLLFSFSPFLVADLCCTWQDQDFRPFKRKNLNNKKRNRIETRHCLPASQ